MSIADEFLSKHSLNSDEPEHFFVDQSTGPTTMRRASPYLNPRQMEFWDNQRTHLEYLNYLHFKHRLDNPNMKYSHDDFDDDDYEEQIHVESVISQEEIDLQNELIRQKELLESTRIKINREVDKFKAMLDDFRAKRERQRLLLTKEYSKRKERYNQDITLIKEAANRKPDIKITVHEVSASEIKRRDPNLYKSYNKTKSTTELSFESTESIYDD